MSTAALTTLAATPAASLKNLPINLFASVMGIAGLSLAWRFAAHQFHAPLWIAHGIGALALAIFVVLSGAYFGKILTHPAAVRNEFNHPIAGNFFGTFNIALLLLSAVIAPFSNLASEVIWTLGSIGALALAFLSISRLLKGQIDPAHALPAWLIPGVATLDITVTGSAMPMGWAREINLLALAIGTAVGAVFFLLIIARLIHHPEKLPPAMTPSLMILMAPFAVGFQAYANITHQADNFDSFAALLFYFGLFLFLILMPKIFRRGMAFAPGWWAIGFPLAALAIAALKYSAAVQILPLTCLAIALLAFLTAVIGVLFFRTMGAIISGSLLRA